MLESIRQQRSFRSTAVLAAVIAWFVVSNRCVLAVFAAPDAAAQIHRCCQEPPAPAERAPEGKPLLCCKVLAVTLPDGGEITVAKTPILLLPDFMVVFAETPLASEKTSRQLDTGPPRGARPFIELVLQRSLPAHA